MNGRRQGTGVRRRLRREEAKTRNMEAPCHSTKGNRHADEGWEGHTDLDLDKCAYGATIIPDELDVFDSRMLRKMLRQLEMEFCLGNV